MIGQDAVSPGFLADPLVRKLLVRSLCQTAYDIIGYHDRYKAWVKLSCPRLGRSGPTDKQESKHQCLPPQTATCEGFFPVRVIV